MGLFFWNVYSIRLLCSFIALCPSNKIYGLNLNILSFLHLPHNFLDSEHIVLVRPEQMESVYETNGTFVYRFQ